MNILDNNYKCNVLIPKEKGKIIGKTRVLRPNERIDKFVY